ncbi:2'-5' RNA ligase family protein [Hymenobacter coccineus]|uniref:Mutarotase n=1 Tax=Hymenobacter coccineus TaxID=1908235 RepID=A0A1G1TK26_9BACT|nr:mutarotase [Hymenobacter coccineus]OGX91197.1 mutarotase [Hymenobacter coccineus]
MDLQAYYDAMRATAIQRLTQGQAALDPLIDSPDDDRRGLTLLARPPARITAALAAIMDDFRRTEPHQYYYPAADVHLTVLSIISCYRGFELPMVDAAAYRATVREIVGPVRPFGVTLSGLTASPGGIIVQGTPTGPGLAELRDRTRAYFQHSPLQQSIDQRYSIQTAHSTVIRFRANLLDTKTLLTKIEKYQHHFIGTFEVDEVELVFNDWYQRAANTVLLEKYTLAGA